MSTPKDAFLTAHNALSALELHFNKHPSAEFNTRKSEIEAALRHTADYYPSSPFGDALLRAIADALKNVQ